MAEACRQAAELLLQRWGAAQANPELEVSVGCALGALDQPGRSTGGHRCLSLVEHHVVYDRQVLVVEQILRDLAEAGGTLLPLVQVAEMRYARVPRLSVEQQHLALGVARNTYRARVDRLLAEVARRAPGLLGQVAALEQVAGVQRAQRARQQRVVRAAAAAAHRRAL